MRFNGNFRFYYSFPLNFTALNRDQFELMCNCLVDPLNKRVIINFFSAETRDEINPQRPFEEVSDPAASTLVADLKFNIRARFNGTVNRHNQEVAVVHFLTAITLPLD